MEYTVCVKIEYAVDEYSKEDIKRMVEDFLKPMYEHGYHIWKVEVKGTI